MGDRIEINMNICHGQPVIKGTRVLVSQLLGAMAGGDSMETVLADYPGVTSADLFAAFAFAGNLARYEEVPYGLCPA